jgi:hypothetical protein
MKGQTTEPILTSPLTAQGVKTIGKKLKTWFKFLLEKYGPLKMHVDSRLQRLFL